MAGYKNGRPLDLFEIQASVNITGKQMVDTNGELRFRMAHPSGLSVHITDSLAKEGGWQNSHRHLSEGLQEVYCVQQGWVVVAHQDSDGVHYMKHVAGQSGATLQSACFTLHDLFAHNIYVGPNTVFATVKYGSEKGREDWVPCPELDEYLATENIDEILDRCG